MLPWDDKIWIHLGIIHNNTRSFSLYFYCLQCHCEEKTTLNLFYSQPVIASSQTSQSGNIKVNCNTFYRNIKKTHYSVRENSSLILIVS